MKILHTGNFSAHPFDYTVKFEHYFFQLFEEVFGKEWDCGQVEEVVHEAQVPERDDVDQEVGEEGDLQH